jgi:glycosyltransferase involved in cell wall biosynthesis
MNIITSHLPLVSVIIPAYNAQAFIARTLESVISQSYKNIEVIVVNDGSLDRTGEIVESFAQKDSRIVLYNQSNKGVAAARNLAIEKSKGEYIAPIDADDIWYPQKLEKQVRFMLEADSSVGLVYAWSVFIDEEDVIIGEYRPYQFWTFHNVEKEAYHAMLLINVLVNGSTPLIRRTCFKKVGGYNSKLREQKAQGCEDWDLYLRIAEHYQFRLVPEFLIGYRQITRSMSRNYKSMERSYNLVMADARKRRPEVPLYIYNWSASSFYMFLSHMTKEGGNDWHALVLLYKSIKLDYIPLLRKGVYIDVFVCLAKIGVKSLFSLIFPAHHAMLKLNKKKQKSDDNIAVNQQNTIAEIQKQVYSCYKNPRQPYEIIRRQRWLQIVQGSQTISDYSQANTSLTITT